MKVLISGSSGLVGKALCNLLIKKGIAVYRLVREDPDTNPQAIFWDPYEKKINLSAIENFDAVVHLAGENIASGRWTKALKEKIADSRILPTGFLAESLIKLNDPPKVFLSASALGFYGDRPDENLDEDSLPGEGFLAEVAKKWEEASYKVSEKGIRLVNMRIGVVLSKHGGALKRMLPVFKLGLGGRLGDGKQFMSWIGIEDLCRAIHFSILNQNISAAVNFVSPNPVTNSEFTKMLAKVLRRPALLPVPKFAPRMIFGQMADEILFSNAKIFPKKLHNNGFKFKYPELHDALKSTLS